MSIRLYDHGASTVLILPLAAMHEEYRSRARQCGIGCSTWTPGCDLSTAPQLLLVAVEQCSWPDLQGHMATLVRLGRLARIVVDEAHLLEKHESFRPCMAMLSFFGKLSVSLVLMTATCPKDLEGRLFVKLGRTVYQVLRQSTDRPEISQGMLLIQGDLSCFEEQVAHKVISAVSDLGHHERALLFCNSRDECDRMATLLGWRPYHSSVAENERTQSMRMWKDGEIQGLACTAMLNCCLDYPNVRDVFHLGPPRDAVDYYQAIGRAARVAGGTGTSIVYFHETSLRKPRPGADDIFGKRVIYDMLSDKSLCRRLRPSFFLDGIGVPCSMLPRAQLCDLCTAQSSCPLPDPGLHRIPNHLTST
jgi:superfamily II DNA helicase RecQ